MPSLYSKIIEDLIIKKTPAVTIVAACNKELTGVGPSIASGNQVCNPICADLPIAPINKKNATIDNLVNKNPKKMYLSAVINGIKLKTIMQSVVLKVNNKRIIAIIKNTSAIRFIIIAFNAALFANIRVYQKLINK